MNHNIQDDIKEYQIKSSEANQLLNTVQSLYGSHIERVMKQYAAALHSTYTHHYCGPSIKAEWHWDIQGDWLHFGWSEFWGDSTDSDNYTIPLTYLWNDSLLPAFQAACEVKVEQNKAAEKEKERQTKLAQLAALQKELGL